MAFSIATMQTRLGKRLGNISDVDFLLQISTDLNQFLYGEMFNADPERFILTTSYSVSDSPSSQPLPTGFRDNTEYGCGFFIQNSDGTATPSQLMLTSYGANDLGYYINGSNVVFTGVHEAKTFVLRYIPTLDDFTTDSGTFVVPDENKELVQEGLVLYYYRYNEDPREADQDLRFTRLLNLFRANLPKGPKVYGLPSKFVNNTGLIRNDMPVY